MDAAGTSRLGGCELDFGEAWNRLAVVAFMLDKEIGNDRNVAMKTHLLRLLLMASLLLCLPCCNGNPEHPNLNNLSEKEYTSYNLMMIKEFKKDPQSIAEKSKEVIIGMSGLEKRPDAHAVFEVDSVFNLNAMLLLVANANDIKRDKGFLEEVEKQAAGVREKLKSEEQKTYLDVFMALCLKHQRDLKE